MNELKPTPNYDAWRITPRENFSTNTWENNIYYLLGWAILAPSAHNKQGWSVTIDKKDQTVSVCPKLTDLGTPSDAKGRQTYIGVGTFTENLLLASKAHGLKTQDETIEMKNCFGVRIDLSNASDGRLVNPTILNNLLNRRTYRGKFKPENKISPNVEEKIKQIAADQDIPLKLILDQPTKIVLAEAQAAADRVVILVEKFRQELGHHLVPNNTLATRVMPGETFGLSDASAVKVHAALLTRGQFDGDFASGLANSDRDAICDSSAVGVISVPEDEPSNWIKAGMVFEKIWLFAQESGLGLGVMAAMVESTIHNIVLKGRLGQVKERPTVVFRLGIPTEDYPHSPRVRFEDILSD